MNEYDYFYGRESQQYAFYRTPKVLFTELRFKDMSAEAKLLYGILLDRMNLSMKNNWMDDQGRTYIYMTIENIEEAMGCSHQKAGKLLSELEESGLIERKRQGICKPNMIYVKNFYSVNNAKLKISKVNTENQHSGMSKISIQECPKSAGNNTDINNTYINNTNLSIYQDEMDGYEEYFLEQLNYKGLIVDYPFDKEQIDSIFSIIIETMHSTKNQIVIGGEYKPIAVVKSQFMKLDRTHIEYVLECLGENRSPIKNVKQYILTSLYNAPLTIGTYYQAKVNGAFYGNGGNND